MTYPRLATLACLLLLFCRGDIATAGAATVSELQDSGRLQVRSWLVPAQNIVPGQQVELSLEIATDRWFTGGTRIQIPEVPGLVLLQTDNFASNSSEQRNGQSWVVQRWSLELYPQRAGRFTIPAISAQVKIGGEGGSTLTGEVKGPALQFSATRPESLARATHWVAAPEYSVRQSFDRRLTGLAVGDAIERTVIFAAEDIMAMMLPAFQEQQISGLRAYPKPPTVDNSSNRGTTKATRTQTITYIVEEQGEYRLPAQDFFWWDTRSAQLQLLSLPAVDIQAGAGLAADLDEAPTRSLRSEDLRGPIGALLLLGAMLWLGRKLAKYEPVRRIKKAADQLLKWWHKLRQPGLPTDLNPGK